MANAEPGRPTSLGEIAGGLAGDVQDLVKGELALARAEFDQKLHGIIAGAVSVIGGALVAFAGLVVLLEGGAAILEWWVPVWASLLIVGAVIILVGALIARAGLAALTLRNLTPNKTASNLGKDARLVKEHI
jgi:Putative Actinobacterial Holin-X, holin superfamily III